MPDTALIKDCLRLLGVAGLNPKNDGAVNRIYSYLILVNMVILLILNAMDLIYKNNGFEAFVESGSILIAAYQILCKIAVIVYFRKDFVRTLDILDKFWPLDKYGEDLKTRIGASYDSSRKIGRTFMMLFILAAAVYFSKPILMGEKELPITLYFEPRDWPWYDLMYGWIVSQIIFAYPALIGFDLLFTSLITYAVCEMKMIQHGLATLNASHAFSVEQFYDLVDHHNLIIRFVKSVDENFSLILLNQFLTNTFNICLSLFMVSQLSYPPHLEDIGKPITYMCGFSMQLFLYCYFGNEIMFESTKIADAAFASSWWVDMKPNIKRGVIQTIQRAHRPLTLTGGGMLTVNLQTFIAVVKTAFSFFTILQAVYGRQ